MNALTTKDLTNERGIDEIYEEIIIPMYIGSRKTGLPMHSFLLLGAPGIGKTEITKQSAERIAKLEGKIFVTNTDLMKDFDLLQDVLNTTDKYFVFVDLDLSKMEPSDFGIPDLNANFKDAFVYKIPAILSALTKHPGMLFLDEMTNIQREDMIAAIHKIVAEKKIGSSALHQGTLIVAAGNRDEDAGIIKSHILTAPLVNRFQIIKVLPPKAESWFLHISEKYPEVPRYLIGFMSGLLKDLYTKNDHLYRNVEDLPMDQRMFTTPRSMEAFCKAYYLLKASGMNFNYKTIVSSLTGFLSPEDYAQISVFLEQMSKLQEVLDKNTNISRSTQIGALTYIGEMIRDLALAENVSFVEQNALLPYNKINFYVNTFGKNKELLGFVMLGSGICDKNVPLTRSIYTMGVLIGVLQGKDPVSAKKFADAEFKYSITDLFNVSNNKLKDLYAKIDKYCSGDPILSKMADIFNYYNGVRINETIELFKSYYIKLKEDAEKQRIKDRLKDFLSENEIRELTSYVTEEVNKRLSSQQQKTKPRNGV